MINKNARLYTVQVLSSLSIWITLVCCFWEIGFAQNLSPIKLGLMSFSFSGAMALFNAFMTVLVKPIYSKIIMLVTLAIDIVLYILLYTANLNKSIIYVYIFLIAACFSSVSISKDKIFEVTSLKGADASEKIFKFMRFIGPIVGGIIVEFLNFKNIMLLNVILLFLSILAVLTVENPLMNIELEKTDTKYITSDTYEKNANVFHVFLVMAFVITITIQMIDAQLVSVFHLITNVSAASFGLCIGISGIGVFLISSYFKKYFVTELFLYIGFLAMGILMIFAGSYFASHQTIPLLLIFSMFLIGGLSWQLIMTTQENIIKSISNRKKMLTLFSVIGIILILSYSLGALSSGFIVNKIGIAALYTWGGYALAITGVLGKIIVTTIFLKSN
ncbi:macrolide transporter [Streptococcus mutans]|uniref:macrolide transporter n=1 Tax=Streptococcus mutans TaxID=1309 RepID=UPI0028E4BA88|nr:macrolide transporter [Streptococcus mutans]MDT9524314.1 macrolide transporter [Streptococcus mutans]MDT9526061.1 macrolide transporter [Streptococcus mutans]MDT9527906.1 macrolide transporter [Streptococcus mutans]